MFLIISEEPSDQLIYCYQNNAACSYALPSTCGSNEGGRATHGHRQNTKSQVTCKRGGESNPRTSSKYKIPGNLQKSGGKQPTNIVKIQNPG